MTECPNCERDVPELEDCDACPECGLSREGLFAVAAGHTPPSERDTGVRRDPLRPFGGRDSEGGDES